MKCIFYFFYFGIRIKFVKTEFEPELVFSQFTFQNQKKNKLITNTSKVLRSCGRYVLVYQFILFRLIENEKYIVN